MLIPKKVLNFLSKTGEDYKVLEHRKVYTALDKARTLREKESVVGKTVIIKADRDFLIALISSDKIIDKQKLKKIISHQRKKENKKAVKKIDFANERWIKNNLKTIKEGSVPPLGVLWNLSTFADSSFLKNKKIILNSGNYNYSIELSVCVFKKIIPDLIIGSFSKKRPLKKKKPKKNIIGKKKNKKKSVRSRKIN